MTANWNASNAVVSPALGRSIAGGLPNLTINLVQPGQVWGERVNEIDLRVAKVVRFGRTRTTIGIDIFNLVNSDAVLTYNQTFSPTVPAGPGGWLSPLSVLTPCFAKIGAQIDF